MKDLKRILSYLKYYKFPLFMSLFLVMIETSFELIIPFFMKNIIDLGITQNDTKEVIYYGGLVIGCAIISLISGNLYARFCARTVTNFSFRLREELYKKIQEFSFSNLDHFDSATLITRVTNDVTIMQNTLSGGIRPLVRAPFMLILGVGLSFMLAPNVAWIFTCSVPILAVLLFVIVKNVAPKYSILQKNVDKVNEVVRENVTAIRTVKAYVKEDYEKEKFDKANNDVKLVTKSTYKIAQLNSPLFQLTMYTSTVLILYVGSRFINLGTLEVGALSAMLSYVLQVINSLIMISNTFLLINKSFASSKRLCEIFDEKIDIVSNDKKLIVQDGTIEFKNVSFKYKEGSGKPVLSNINLLIKSGESIGIIGPTGSSKSTLVSLMMRLYDASEGEVLVGNHNVKDYDLVSLRDSISIVLQNNVLFSGSVYDNLLWGNKNATIDEINEALKISCSDEFIKRLPGELNYDLGQGGVNVSGGQKQRLCIARALLKKPKVIIFDDSTSACDMETERKIIDQIRSLTNITNIVIGQRIKAVMGASRIIVLEDGMIKQIGTHEELLKTNKIYQELYEAQIGGQKNE